jgi:DNA-binding CsgD family transcriptional regulator
MGRGRDSHRPSDLLERARELEQIDAALAAAIAGDGGVVLLEGRPGIGKTALLDAARHRARRRRMIALTARGSELERQFPYGIVRQLFEPILRQTPETGRSELFLGSARLAAPVVLGVDEGKLATADAGADAAFARMHGLYWLAVNVSNQSPTLVAVDDLHWADAPSLRFLHYLARRLEGLPVLIVAAARTVQRGADTDPSTQLAAEHGAHVIRPAALTDHAVGLLLSAGLGRPAEAPFAEACGTATGGVPFLVHELVAALAADDVEPTTSQAELIQKLGPPTVARATLARLARMPEGCVPLARAIAVLGGDAQLPRAAQLAGLSETDLLPALDALVEANTIRAGNRLEFVHPIVRAAIYDELAPGERSALHRRAASLLAAEGAELDAVAAQLLASEPTGSPEVIERLREAALLARRLGAPDAAVAYLTRALEEGCERELRAELQFELGSAGRLAGAPAVRHFREARRLTEDPLLSGLAALEMAPMLAMRGAWDAAAELVEEALAELGDRAPGIAARLEAFHAGNQAADPRHVGEFDRRLGRLRELARKDGVGERTLAMVLASVSAWRGHDAEEVVALVDHAWGAGPLSAGVEPWALGEGLRALIVSEELERAGTLVDALTAEAGRCGSLTGYVLSTAYRGWLEARQGRVGAAEAALRVALEPALEQRFHYVASWQLWLATDVLLERPQAGDLAAATETVELGSLAALHGGAQLLEVRGRVRGAAGKAAAGIADLRHAGEIFQALGYSNPNASNWRSALALMLGAADRDEALQLVDEELEDARRVGHPRAIGVALRAVGLLQGGVTGLDLLEQAVSTLERSPARLELARALVELGSAKRRAGERAAAREPLRAGLDVAVDAGATRLIERAQTELAATGARPRRVRTTGPEALTPSELRVARLAAEGRTNNEVAQALFVTPKTVDTHLAHAYAKLGISSRRALSDALELSPPRASESPRSRPAA